MAIQVGDFKLGEEERKAIMEVIDSGKISEGRKVKEFEQKFAKFVGTRYCIAVSSGTAALMCGLTALKHHSKYTMREHTKIITAPITYIATSNAIMTTNFEPVYVDVDPETFVITPDNIKAHLEGVDDASDYSMILPVHLIGYAADMDAINKIAKKYGLLSFEDSAQAHGTIYNGKKTGSCSLLSDFSFYIAHNIQAGEMGALVTDDIELARLITKVKANGRMCDCFLCVRSLGKCSKMKEYTGDDDLDSRFTHDIIGYNFKTMEFQAALGLVQLEKADWIIKKRQENVKYLNEGLSELSDILMLPKYSTDISYLAYPIKIKSDKISRKKLRYELEKNGIETRTMFGCIPTQQPAYAHLKEAYAGKLPNADYIGKNALYVGCHQYLTQDDLDTMIRAFKKIVGGVGSETI